MEHHRIVEFFRNFLAARLRELDHFHRKLVFDAAREREADVASAGDYNAFVGALDFAELAHHRIDVLGGSNEKHLVIGFDYRIAPRGDGLAAPIDGGNAGIHLGHVLP